MRGAEDSKKKSPSLVLLFLGTDSSQGNNEDHVLSHQHVKDSTYPGPMDVLRERIPLFATSRVKPSLA